ncbi:MAG: dihydrodipicolinate synthase family protein [Verrucomicrobiales bacterium]|nr:dihydrodipicolinate synthase family protein [Verrucomicrobiales bacterium]
MANTDIESLRNHLAKGLIIPAMPLALDENRSWDRRYQRALVRYYVEAGAGGIAVGVHSTQFEIREPEHALFEPVLEFCAEAIDATLPDSCPFVRIAGVCGNTEQASREADFAVQHGYDAALLSLSALAQAGDGELIRHCETIGETVPLIGFYLQPTIGGRSYGYSFWRRFVEIPSVVAIKVAPFDRYATLDVVRALADSGREDVFLYTGNDDNIIHDLLSTFSFGGKELRFVGGLLGQWAVGTKQAVSLLEQIKSGGGTVEEWTRKNAALTDLNGAIFDPANGFRGCLSGMNEMLRRDGLLPTNLCLAPSERLSPGQAEELDRVSAVYPDLLDRDFIADNIDRWLVD